jgi:hypothetical protein
MEKLLIGGPELRQAMTALVMNTVNMAQLIDPNDARAAGIIIGRIQAIEEIAIAAGINPASLGLARLKDAQPLKLLKAGNP